MTTTPMLIAANAAEYETIAASPAGGQIPSVASIANVAHSAAPAAQTEANSGHAVPPTSAVNPQPRSSHVWR